MGPHWTSPHLDSNSTLDSLRQAPIRWRRSSFCITGDCVEVMAGEDLVRVRDSKDAWSAVLTFTASEWGAFVQGVRNGEFDVVH